MVAGKCIFCQNKRYDCEVLKYVNDDRKLLPLKDGSDILCCQDCKKKYKLDS